MATFSPRSAGDAVPARPQRGGQDPRDGPTHVQGTSILRVTGPVGSSHAGHLPAAELRDPGAIPEEEHPTRVGASGDGAGIRHTK